MNRRKIAIIGKAPSSRGLAPYSDESWEIWTISDLVLVGQAPRWSRHFEIHPLKWIKDRKDGYYNWLTEQPAGERPIYLRELSPDIPAGVLYPVDKIVPRFRRYFTNQISYMIAMAIMENPEAIGIWGVDMAQSEEYQRQKPSCEYLIGVAEGAGIKVELPPECDLLQSPRLYGFETDESRFLIKWKARQQELKRRIASQQAKRDEAHMQMAFLSGALENQEHTHQYIMDEGLDHVPPGSNDGQLDGPTGDASGG